MECDGVSDNENDDDSQKTGNQCDACDSCVGFDGVDGVDGADCDGFDGFDGCGDSLKMENLEKRNVGECSGDPGGNAMDLQ